MFCHWQKEKINGECLNTLIHMSPIHEKNPIDTKSTEEENYPIQWYLAHLFSLRIVILEYRSLVAYSRAFRWPRNTARIDLNGEANRWAAENLRKKNHGNLLLVGGFNPFEKYQSNWIISPGRGEHKKSLKPPPSLFPVAIFDSSLRMASPSVFNIE